MEKRTLHTVEGVFRNLPIKAFGEDTDLMCCWECPQYKCVKEEDIETGRLFTKSYQCIATGEELFYFDGPIRSETCKSETFETSHTAEERSDENLDDGI